MRKSQVKCIDKLNLACFDINEKDEFQEFHHSILSKLPKLVGRTLSNSAYTYLNFLYIDELKFLISENSIGEFVLKHHRQ